MRYRRIFHIVAMAILLSLLVIALPASPALAAEEIELDPEEGEIGERIDIEGWDFMWDFGIYVYFSSEEADEGDDIDDEVQDYYERVKTYSTDEDGEFSTYFTVPDELTDGDKDEDVSSGTYYVYVTYEDDDTIEAVAEFDVIASEIDLNPEEGPVGTEVRITGTGFNDREEIIVDYDGDEIDIESGDGETDRNGDFECTIIIPESPADEHTITVTDDADAEAEAEFTVEPAITAPATGSPGQTITVEGTGFGERVDVTIEFDGEEVAEDETDREGSFTVTFTLPAKGPGTYKIRAEDEDRHRDEINFNIATEITLSKTTGNVGSEVTVSGSGFTPNKTVTVTYASEPEVVATTTADSTGEFSATFTVPKSKHGAHTITASDTSGVTSTTTFTVESTPPEAPEPLIPEEGARAKSQAFFDWEDVTDPSGISYTLQVATSENFTDIVMERTEISKSEYTLTEKEKLETTSDEAPYYWRVKAIDGAENESEWTTAIAFYVGSAFLSLFGGWKLYALIGLIILVVILIIVLLRRRPAAYQ